MPGNLVVILGDQLNRDASAWDGFDPARDRAWMAEVTGEAEHVWSTKPRIAMFLVCMRHFAAALRADGVPLDYTELVDSTLGAELARTLREGRFDRVILTEPGELRVLDAIRAAVGDTPLEVREDRHFLCSHGEFGAHAAARKSLRMEYFYREMRKRHRVLMDGADPVGGSWNFDAENRGAFGKMGPGLVPPPAAFPPDALTRDVLALVNDRFAAHPGKLDSFAWPVTRAQALESLDRFVRERLPQFGSFQDAMWTGEPWLYHAHISSALNLKLLDPREVIAAAELAYREKRAPLAGVEGFIRQVLGWREYVRGIYWLKMPGYADSNALGATEDLPAFYWTGETRMRCLAESIGQTLEHGYAHHIQRLMVTGLYALMLGVAPRQVHEWYLAVYVDAIEWVELPNTLGMSQFADGGLLGSKPYVATGRYIDRMSDYCTRCPFDPALRTGPAACPFTTLYWDFLDRHQERLAGNARMSLQVNNLLRVGPAELAEIRLRAEAIRRGEV